MNQYDETSSALLGAGAEAQFKSISEAGAAVQPSREDKHIALHRAINEIETVKYHMLDVLDEIKEELF